VRIPDVKGVARSVPSAQTQVTRSDPYSEIGSALQGLGQAAAREVDERASYQTAQARTSFIKERIEQDSAFEEDLEYADLPERYEESLRKRLSAVSETIANPRAREMFVAEQETRIAEGKARQQTRAIGIERDTERANVSNSLNALNEAGLNAEDPREMLGEVGSLLESAVEAGYYTAEEAGRTERVWKDTFAANKISMMEPDRRLEALEQPWAGNIPTVVREKLREEALRDGRAARTVETSERFWGEAGGDYNKALAMAAEIEDVDDRLAVESRLTTINSRENAARVDLENEAADRAWAILAEGGTPDDIDLRDWNALGGRAKIAIEGFQQQRVNAEQSGLDAISSSAYDMIELVQQIDPALYMQGPEAWPEQLQDLYGQLQPADARKLTQDLLTRSREGDSAPEVRSNFNLVTADMGITAEQVLPLYREDVRKIMDPSNATQEEAKADLLAIVNRRTREWTAEHGGAAMPEADRRQIIRTSFNELDSKKFKALNHPWREPLKMAQRMDGEIRGALRKQLGREPTDAEVQANIQRMMERK